MKIKSGRCYLLAGVAFVFSSPAFAQATPPDDEVGAETSSAGGLGEIIVTAQRRAENSQDVPIAISSFSGKDAEIFGISGVDTISSAVPGFTFPLAGPTATPFLRGVGTLGSSPGNEPAVAMFVDDVYIPTGYAAIFDFNSINSIEVLKGPQGTLFGRNATGGVIQVRTLDPSFETTGDFDIGYANYDTVSGHAYISTGLTDNVAVNLAAYGNKQHDGWGVNIPTDEEIFKKEAWGVRGKLLINAGDDTEILLTGGYNYLRSDLGIAYRTVPGIYGLGGYDAEAEGAGFYDGGAGRAGYYNARYRVGSAKVTHDFENATLVSITAYGHSDSFFTADIDVAPTVFFENNQAASDQKTFTQELQLVSPDHSKINWILGAFFMSDKANLDNVFTVGGGGNNVRASQRTRSISGFAQASMEILPRLTATMGIRYTSDTRSARGVAYDGLPLADPAVPATIITTIPRESTTNSDITGRFALNYELTPDVNIYAAYNRGFKSGLYNFGQISTSSTEFPPVVLPEELNAFTAGFKSELFGRRVRLNAEAYYYDYKNIQVNVLLPSGNLVTNGGAATIKGFDIDLTVVPLPRLTINASLAYAHGRYDEFDNGPQFFPQPPNEAIPIPAGCPFTTYPTSGQVACDLAGNKTVQTVPLATNLSVQYLIPTGIGDFTIAGNWEHTGGQYFVADNNPASKQPKVNPINLSLNWTSSDGNLGIRFWARNITKEKYYAYLAQSAIYTLKYAPAAPRTYGVTLSAGF